MKRFQFQLEKLLRYHQQRQKQAELAMVRAARELELAQAAVRELQHQIHAACQLSEDVGRPIDPILRDQSLRLVQHLERSLRPAQVRLKAADSSYREAQVQHTAVTQQVESLLLLRTQRWQEHLDEINRQQQIELDDTVMKQWSKRSATFEAEVAASVVALGDQ